uniref:Putative lipocalin-3 1 n=1 Tax=Amblyomma americanum TaxID=6943 RepID=A0A0C9S570_AMBAM
MGEALFTKHVMAARQVVLVFISTVLFAAAQAESDKTEAGRTVDIKEFLLENQKVSVYEATDRGNKMCVTDVYTAVTAADAVFKRYFANGTKPLYLDLKGVFGPTEQERDARFTTMSVYMVETSGTKFSDETMLYFSPDGNCGVFNVTDYTGESWYDVRVKYDTVKLKHTSCFEFYKDLRRDTKSRSVYQNTCPPVNSNIKE